MSGRRVTQIRDDVNLLYSITHCARRSFWEHFPHQHENTQDLWVFDLQIFFWWEQKLRRGKTCLNHVRIGTAGILFSALKPHSSFKVWVGLVKAGEVIHAWHCALWLHASQIWRFSFAPLLRHALTASVDCTPTPYPPPHTVSLLYTFVDRSIKKKHIYQ